MILVQPSVAEDPQIINLSKLHVCSKITFNWKHKASPMLGITAYLYEHGLVLLTLPPLLTSSGPRSHGWMQRLVLSRMCSWWCQLDTGPLVSSIGVCDAEVSTCWFICTRMFILGSEMTLNILVERKKVGPCWPGETWAGGSAWVCASPVCPGLMGSLQMAPMKRQDLHPRGAQM